MRIPWFQFTLKQLIALIVAMAIVFALLRAPFGPLLLAIGITLAGFAIDRRSVGRGSGAGSWPSPSSTSAWVCFSW